MTAARIKASELKEKDWYAKKMEESLGPRDVDAGVGSPGLDSPDGLSPVGGERPGVVGRTPVQEGGSSSSGGGGPPPAIPMSLDRDPKRPGEVAEHFGDFGEQMRNRGRMMR